MDAAKYSPVMHVVVASDLSEAGEDAIREALRLTKHTSGSRVYAVHVLPERNAYGRRRRLDDLDEEITDAHLSLRAQLQSAGSSELQSRLWFRSVETRVQIGRPAQQVHQLAVDVDADLIVMGSAPEISSLRSRQGRLARELTKISGVPVLVARTKSFEGWRPTPEPEPWTPEFPPNDSSRGSGRDLHRSRRNWVHISGLI